LTRLFESETADVSAGAFSGTGTLVHVGSIFAETEAESTEVVDATRR
jgi:hypothetical protein